MLAYLKRALRSQCSQGVGPKNATVKVFFARHTYIAVFYSHLILLFLLHPCKRTTRYSRVTARHFSRSVNFLVDATQHERPAAAAAASPLSSPRTAAAAAATTAAAAAAASPPAASWSSAASAASDRPLCRGRGGIRSQEDVPLRPLAHT